MGMDSFYRLIATRGFEIIFKVFFLWYTGCLVYLDTQYITDPFFIRVITMSSWGFLGLSVGLMNFIADKNLKYLPACLFTLTLVTFHIVMSSLGFFTDRTFVGLSLVLTLVFGAFILRLIEDRHNN